MWLTEIHHDLIIVSVFIVINGENDNRPIPGGCSLWFPGNEAVKLVGGVQTENIPALKKNTWGVSLPVIEKYNPVRGTDAKTLSSRC